jgi:hypothetical protein
MCDEGPYAYFAPCFLFDIRDSPWYGVLFACLCCFYI